MAKGAMEIAESLLRDVVAAQRQIGADAGGVLRDASTPRVRGRTRRAPESRARCARAGREIGGRT